MSAGEQKADIIPVETNAVETNAVETNGTISQSVSQPPAYMKKYKYDKSSINKAVRPPFIKYINFQSKPPYKPPFMDYDIIVSSYKIKIGDKTNTFTFVPLIYVPTFNIINPYEMKGQLPFTRSMTYDEDSVVAKKCKTFCKTDPCPENPQYMLQYRHTHNFFIIVEGQPDLEDMIIWMPLSGGEFNSGQNLIALIHRKNAPYYGIRFRCHSGDHSGKEGNWIGLDFLYHSNIWVEEERCNVYEQIATQWDELIKDRMVDLTEDEDFVQQGAPAAAETKF